MIRTSRPSKDEGHRGDMNERHVPYPHTPSDPTDDGRHIRIHVATLPLYMRARF